jgi:hypothetical protein
MPTGAGRAAATRFFLLSLGPGGRPASLKLLPIRPFPHDQVLSIALTADGTKLAVATLIRPGATNAVYGIDVVDLANGSSRVWEAHPATSGALSVWLDGLRWAQSDRLLAFRWDGAVMSPYAGFYLLDTAAPDTNLLSARKIVPVIAGNRLIDNAIVTAGGRRLLAAVFFRSKDQRWGRPAIAELSARTGRILRLLYQSPGPATTGQDLVMAADSSGHHILVIVADGRRNPGRPQLALGRIDDGRYTKLLSNPSYAPTAW